MKKLLAIVMLLIGVSAFAQNEMNYVVQAYQVYVTHCNELVDVEVTQTGKVYSLPTGIYDKDGKLLRYEWNYAEDTLWADPVIPEYKFNYDSLSYGFWASGVFYSDSISIRSIGYVDTIWKYYHEPKSVNRTITVQVKREKPSRDGFYKFIESESKDPKYSSNILGFANYCMEAHVYEPTHKDYLRYISEGGWEHYSKHIENASR